MKFKALLSALLLAVAMFSQSPAVAAEKLNISFVKAPFNLQVIVMKELGLLEKELKPLGVDVVWHEITSGAKQARAMAAGSLDVSSVMNTTSIQMAAAEGNPIKVVAGVSRPVDLFAVVPEHKKDAQGTEAWNPQGVVPRAIAAIKAEVPEMLVMTDVALDPFNTYGQDGIVREYEDGTAIKPIRQF